jgi:hypothetical protein
MRAFMIGGFAILPQKNTTDVFGNICDEDSNNFFSDQPLKAHPVAPYDFQ